MTTNIGLLAQKLDGDGLGLGIGRKILRKTWGIPVHSLFSTVDSLVMALLKGTIP
jgi:hypothetical protein